MKTTISVLAVLIFTVLLGFTFSSDISASNNANCCMHGNSHPGAIINAYYNGVLQETEVADSQGNFTVCLDTYATPVMVTSTSNGNTIVRKGVDRCANPVNFLSQDN